MGGFCVISGLDMAHEEIEEQKLEETPQAASVQNEPTEVPTPPPEADGQATDNPAEAEEAEIPEEPWLTDLDLPSSYNWHWREVIDGLMNRLPAYQAYAEAYDLNIADEKQRRAAEANSSRLMRNDRFRAVWRKVIAERGFNDETVDWELANLIASPDTEPAIRRAAIKDYNELRGRIITKVDHTSKGKRITPPAIISTIQPRAPAQTEATTGN